jgi:hypothetical protein
MGYEQAPDTSGASPAGPLEGTRAAYRGTQKTRKWLFGFKGDAENYAGVRNRIFARSSP